MSRPPVRRSLSAALLHECAGCLHSHTLRRRTLLLKQGFTTPGLFVIVSGEVLVLKELEVVHAIRTTNNTPDPTAPSAQLYHKTIKPIEVAILGAGDLFGDIGFFGDGVSGLSVNSDARRSPVTVLSHSASLEVQFIKRSDVFKSSKSLLRSLRTRSQYRMKSHAERVLKVIQALEDGVVGSVRDKRKKYQDANNKNPIEIAQAQALETFWSNSSGIEVHSTTTVPGSDETMPFLGFGAPSSPPTTAQLSPTAAPYVGPAANLNSISLSSNTGTHGHTTSFSSSTSHVSSIHHSAHPSLAMSEKDKSLSHTHRSTPSTSKDGTSSTTTPTNKPILTKAMIEERKAKKEKENEALQESLNKLEIQKRNANTHTLAPTHQTMNSSSWH